MARHNLAGWMRDVTSLLRSGTDEELEEFFCVMEDANVRLEDWLDVGHRSDTSDVESDDDDTDHAPDDYQDDVDGDESSLREDDAPRARRPASRSEALSAAPSGLGSVVADVPGSVRGTTESDVVDVRSGTMGAPGCGVSRVTKVTVTPSGYVPVEARSVPRGTAAAASSKARTRKGVSRGKKRATTKRTR